MNHLSHPRFLALFIEWLRFLFLIASHYKPAIAYVISSILGTLIRYGLLKSS